MKGLFYKEARCLWQYGKSYILLVVIFFGLAFLNGGSEGANPLWLLYPVFFVGSLPASLLSADEKDGWLTYCDTLPIGRRQIVAVKYVASAALTAAIVVLALLIGALAGRLAVTGGAAAPMPMLVPLLLAVGLGVPALMYPVMFRFGATKGRAVYMAVVMVAAATCAVLMTSESVSGALDALPILPVIVAAAAMFIGSWALSVKWFEGREL